MRAVLSLFLFMSLALAAHAFAFALWAMGGAAGDAEGEGGQALISLAAAPAQIQALVQQWEAPPEVTSVAPAEIAAPEIAALPFSPKSNRPSQTPVIPALPDMRPPQPEAALSVDTVPPPLAAPALDEPKKPELRPKSRPEPKTEKPPVSKPLPKAPSKTADTAVPAQQAAGQGKGELKGSQKQNTHTGPGKAQSQKLIARWGAKISARIERRKRLPAGVKGLGGKVVLRLTVARSGDLISVQIARSSGVAVLDQAAVNAARRAGRFPAAPKGLTAPNYSFNLPLRFAK